MRITLEVLVAKSDESKLREVLDKMVGDPPTRGRHKWDSSVVSLYYADVADEEKFVIEAMMHGATSVNEVTGE